MMELIALTIFPNKSLTRQIRDYR